MAIQRVSHVVQPIAQPRVSSTIYYLLWKTKVSSNYIIRMDWATIHGNTFLLVCWRLASQEKYTVYPYNSTS